MGERRQLQGFGRKLLVAEGDQCITVSKLDSKGLSLSRPEMGLSLRPRSRPTDMEFIVFLAIPGNSSREASWINIEFVNC